MAVAIAAPHFVWAARHDWITLTYAARRAAGEPSPWRHLVYPVRFAIAQLPAVVPAVLLARPALGPRRVTEPFSTRFLDAMVLGPFILHLLVALLAGVKLRSMWGAPLWTFTGVWLLHRYGHELDQAAGRRVVKSVAAVAAVMLLVGARFVAAPYVQPFGERVHFPGDALADAVGAAWRREVGGPLPVVAGPWWLAGNVGFYSPDHPDVYGDVDPVASSWMDDDDFHRRGGVLLWYVDPAGRNRNEQPEGAVADWLRRFPAARPQPPLKLDWQISRRLRPIVLGLAVLPPANGAGPPPPG